MLRFLGTIDNSLTLLHHYKGSNFHSNHIHSHFQMKRSNKQAVSSYQGTDIFSPSKKKRPERPHMPLFAQHNTSIKATTNIPILIAGSSRCSKNLQHTPRTSPRPTNTNFSQQDTSILDSSNSDSVWFPGLINEHCSSLMEQGNSWQFAKPISSPINQQIKKSLQKPTDVFVQCAEKGHRASFG